MTEIRGDDWTGWLDLFPRTEGNQVVWATVKRRFSIVGAELQREPAPELLHNFHDEELAPRWPPGSDYWPFKRASDVCVLGSAHARPGQPVAEMSVAVRVGDQTKRVAVIGDRELRCHEGAVSLSRPRPFEVMPLQRERAYGGRDARVEEPASREFFDILHGVVDPLGAYPRNPTGTGYVIGRADVSDVRMPNLEDPRQRLTADAVIVRTPEEWWKQPLPAHFDWLLPGMFPRSYYAAGPPRVGIAANAVLQEEQRGFLSGQWASRHGVPLQGRPPPPVYFQEAALGLSFAGLEPGTPIVLEGMHPEHSSIEFRVPSPPVLALELEGRTAPGAVLLQHLVVRPDELFVDVTWAITRRDLSRPYIPGVHGSIPIALSVDGQRAEYPTPEPNRAKRKRIAAEMGGIPDISKLIRKPGEPGYYEVQGLLLPEASPQRTRDQLAPSDAPRLGDLDVAGGRLTLSATDVTLRGAARFALTRHYSSSMSWRAGALGLGWHHCLEQAVWIENGWLLYRLEDGREVGMPLSGGELGIGDSTHHPSLGIVVRRVAPEAFEARLADGRRFGFTQVEQSVTTGAPKARLARIWDTDGAALEVGYDTHGRLDRLTLPGGGQLRFEHDARGRLTRVFQPSRDGSDTVLAARYEIDTSGQLREAVDADGHSTRYEYQARMLTRETRPGGLSRRFTYSDATSSARCTGVKWGEDERERELSWSASSMTAGPGDALGGSFSLDVNSAYLPTVVRDHFANVVTRTYDEHSGLLAAQTTPDGETSYLYDAAFHIADVSAPDAGSVALEHDEAGRLVSWADADGHAAKWAWDHLGRLGAAVDRAGASTVYSYDGEGALSGLLAGGELRVTLERESGAVARVGGPGGTRHARRDALGRVVRFTDELGHGASIRYDGCGRVARLELPEELVLSYACDAEGQLTARHDGRLETKVERDDEGRVSAVVRGEGAPRLHRDAEGRVKMVESEGFDFYELIRDAAGRLIEEAGLEGDEPRVIQRGHRGLVKREAVYNVWSKVTRDRAGRPTEVEHSDETFQRFAWSPGGRMVRAQDADRVLELEHDGLGRPRMEKRGDGHWVQNSHGARGREALQSSLGLSVAIERDARGGATQYRAAVGEQSLVLTIERDACGREVRRHLPGGLSLRWTRDALGRPTERAVMFGERVLATLRFTWAGERRLVRVEDPQRGARDHRHDERGRLIQVGGAVRVLDEVGNVFRTEARDDHTYGPGGRLTEAGGTQYRYDALGRRTERETVLGDVTRYRWDGAGRLTEVWLSDDERILYAYDALGRRQSRRRESKITIEGLDEPVWEPSSQTFFYWDGLELLHEVTDGQKTTWLWESGELIGRIDDSGAFAALLDASGMPTELTDAKGNLVWRGSVDLYGVFVKEADEVACPWRFAGHWEDPDTGLLHSWQRVYDPETGAYLSPNPLGVLAGSNLYAHLDDPLGAQSPLGLGEGYAALAGALRSERLAEEMIARGVLALDRGDGAAGPRERFDPDAAQLRLPDAEALFFGPWAELLPAANLPPETASFTRLPQSCGLRGDSTQPTRSLFDELASGGPR